MPSLKAFRRMSGLPDSIRRWSDAAEQVKAGQKALVELALVSKRSLEPRRAPPPNIAWLPGFEMSAANLLSMGEWERAGENHWRTVEEQTIPHEAGLFRSRVYLTNENYAAMQDSKRNRGGGRAEGQSSGLLAPEAGEAGVGVGVDPDAASNPPGASAPGGGDSEAKTMGLSVDWRSVSRNAAGGSLPAGTPWVHGLIRDTSAPSARIEIKPNADGTMEALFVAPDQSEAAMEAIDWDRGTEMTIDGHALTAKKSMTLAQDWACEGDADGFLWQLRAVLSPDHPLVAEAAEAAQGPQDALDKAEREFDEYARKWCDRNFPHPDFMNTVRDLELSEWKHKPEYWPGDPMPDADDLLHKARERLAR